MNQLDIEEYLDRLLGKSESELEKVFNKRLQTILFQISEMYRKYSKNGELGWTEVNKYDRFRKEMQLIAEQLTDDYRAVIQQIQAQMEYQYVEKYLRLAYLIENTAGTAMGFTIPSLSIIQQAVLNPIAELTLPKIFEPHRNELVRRINLEIAQGLQAGEGYADIANRIRNATGFSSKKARLVARTEVGRVRSIAALKVEEKAAQYAQMEKVWMSMLDNRVRKNHRILDGQEADKEGFFHFKKWKAQGPRLWRIASMDIQCRCAVIYKVNGMLPEYRKARDYQDIGYQEKLAARIDQYMADEGLTYKQAIKRAQKEIQPPQRNIPYVSYEDWVGKKSG